MKKPIFDKSRLYERSEDFFRLGPNSTIRLSREAALHVCEEAADFGLLVARVEGGFFHPPSSFEARIDGIWDGLPSSISIAETKDNNEEAKKFILGLPSEYSIFLITAYPWKTI